MKLRNLTLLVLATFVVSSEAAEFTVSQKDKAFSQASIDVAKGDTIHFKNEDPFFHNVYSLSDASTFDLGSYPQGESKSVTFEEVGEVEVECAVHPSMTMKVNVK